MKLFYLQIKRQYSIFHAIIVDMFTIYDLPHILANKFVCGTQLRNNIVLSVACFAHIRRYQFGWENAGTFTNNNKHDKTINASNRFTQNVWRKIALHSKWKWKKKEGKSNEIGRWLKRSAQKLEVIIMKIALATVAIPFPFPFESKYIFWSVTSNVSAWMNLKSATE